jgi:hypothetical protein
MTMNEPVNFDTTVRTKKFIVGGKTYEFKEPPVGKMLDHIRRSNDAIQDVSKNPSGVVDEMVRGIRDVIPEIDKKTLLKQPASTLRGIVDHIYMGWEEMPKNP